MTRKIEAGTVIAGTLRSEDLLEALIGELESVIDVKIDPSITDYGRYLTEALDRDGQIASELVNDLIDALNEYAPEGMYFGTVEGDGADFGWWLIEGGK